VRASGLITPRRLAIAGICLLSLVVCCGLAVWQWQRFQSASGTWQNLGYVLQWPLFGLFPAFLFWRMRTLRTEHAATQPDVQPAEEPPPARPRPVAVRDDDGDPELAAYNRYLAQLNARDRQEAP
jgi:DNA-binding transcriptional regulator of glucitol operon